MNEQREKKYIRQTFSKFVSKSVVDELLKDPDKLKLGGEKEDPYRSLFGHTGLYDHIRAPYPEALVEHLNEYLQAMTDIVLNITGRSINTSATRSWHSGARRFRRTTTRCSRPGASVEMMRVLGELNRKWVAEGKPELHIGIGLNTGDMVVGNMGSSSRMDYTLMGDNVNLGARLEGTNKVYGTSIIISEATYEYVKEHIVARELDLIRVKGKELPVKIYELVDMKEG
jgi:adenylate cyclase